MPVALLKLVPLGVVSFRMPLTDRGTEMLLVRAGVMPPVVVQVIWPALKLPGGSLAGVTVKLNAAGVVLMVVGLPGVTESQAPPPATVHDTGRTLGFAGALDRLTLVVIWNGAAPFTAVSG